ncbi:MAG: hypothetical protein WDA23_06910 [Gemmobacter sp.]
MTPRFLRPLILALAVLPGGAGAEPPAPPAPVPVAEGVAAVGEANLIPQPPTDRLLVRLAFPAPADLPPVPPEAGPAHRLLAELFAAGRAAGNHGDLYENRDRGHSRLRPGDHPQLTHIRYGDTLRGAGLDYGLAGPVLFDAPLIGNSSTALTAGPMWRSLGRMALTSAGGPRRLFQNHVAGQIHVYPEHRDHDPERGDLFPANTPYMIVSQGSSGSDRPHLEALAMILAAFRPDTKAFMHERGLIAPTVQMVWRRSQSGVLTRGAYLSGLAHPGAFEADRINLMRKVRLANAILPDEVPPMVRLRVLSEQPGTAEERLFDTPSAIARVWRNPAQTRVLTVSAETTRDPNGRDLHFTWALLRGDPARVRIAPEGPSGARARIEVDWQGPRPVPGRADLTSARVDIGVFAHNGVHDSAPAFVSVLLPRHEIRRHETGADGISRAVEIIRRPGVYADPALFPVTP